MKKYEINRVLVLYNILSSMTDEDHHMTLVQIKEEMSNRGCACSDDSIFRYMNQLRKELGVDIISSKGRNASYFIGSRILDKEEIQVIIDAVSASTIIDKTTTKKIIGKVKGLTSIHIADTLDRTILSSKQVTREKQNILYRISDIQRALDDNCQIRFEYVDWTLDKRLSNTGRIHEINPWGLLWANDRYYLFGYTIKDDEEEIEERTFRVDKMKKIEKIDRPRQGSRKFKSFNVYDYVSRRIDMFSDEEELVTVRIPHSYVGIFIDRFGKGITIEEVNQKKIDVTFEVACSKYFFGWLLGIEEAEIITPDNVRKDMVRFIEKSRNIYKK